MKCYTFSCFLRTGKIAVHVHSSDSFIPLSACPVTKSYLIWQPHRLQPALLLCPWDFPGKNTRVGCGFLLQGILLNSGIKSASLVSPALISRVYTIEPYEKPSPKVQFSSVSQSCPTLWPLELKHTRPSCPSATPREPTQTHVHWVGDAIQPPHPLSSPSPPALKLCQHQGLFQWVNSSHEVAKVLELQLQHQTFQWTPRTDLLEDGLVGTPCSPRDSQESSPTPQFKSINSSALSFLYSPTLTSIHDYWKNHSLD